jgi:hypothetical protein
MGSISLLRNTTNSEDKMNFSTSAVTKTALLAATLLAASSAFAAPPPPPVWTDVGPASGFVIDGNTITYTPSPALEVKYYNDNIANQSAANIMAVINTQFGLTGLNALAAVVSQCDNPTSACTNGSGALASTPYSNSFTSNGSYDYLAVHFGRGELLFHWSAPLAAGTTFSIGGLPRGLSNYRAYLSPTAPVPEPGTYAMLLGGLGLLGMISRRRSAAKK